MVPRLWVKLYPSAELKPIQIAVPTVLGELQCGLTTSVYFGMGWRELLWKRVRQLCRVLRRMRSPVVTFKILDPVWINPTGYKRIVLRKTLFQNKPLHVLKSAFRKVKPEPYS